MRVRFSSKKYWSSNKKRKGKRFPRTWKSKEQSETESDNSDGPPGVQYFFGGPVIFLLRNMDNTGEESFGLDDIPSTPSSSDFLEEFQQHMVEEDGVENSDNANDHSDLAFGKDVDSYIDQYLRNEEFDVEEILPTDDWAQYLENWGSDLDNSETIEENAVSSLLTPTDEEDPAVGGNCQNDYRSEVVSTAPISHEYL